MKETAATEKNASTEEKIKEAARVVFTRKGYAATRTRDIAEESGYNLALINYYFRSKEKLFDIIMLEQLQIFVHSITGILNDNETTFQEKINTLVAHYIDMLIANPGLPVFILSEINADPEKLIAKIGLPGNNGSLHFVAQWKETAGRMAIKINPVHLLMNIVSMTVFPFIASPILRSKTGMTTEEFNTLMEERKKLIPIWIGGMLHPNMQQ